MSERDETERDGVRERLLDVLLEEEFRAPIRRPDAHLRRGQDARGSRVARRAPVRLLPAAVLVLGPGAVAAALLLPHRAPADQALQQDPIAPAQLVVPRDVDHLRELLAVAKGLRLVRREIAGAHRAVDDQNSVVDQLDLVSWPEVHEVADATIDRWRKALERSIAAPGDARHRELVTLFDLELLLPEQRTVRCFVNLLADSAHIEAGTCGPLAADAELLQLLVAAHGAIEQRRRRNLGIAADDVELAQLPADQARISCPVGLIGHLGRFEDLRELRLEVPGEAPFEPLRRLSRLEAIELAGIPLDPAKIIVLAGLPSLRRLTLRECTGLEQVGLHALGRLLRLETLHCIDVQLGPTRLEGIVTLPRLREFGLRPAAGSSVDLLPIGRTKLERLLLVDAALDRDHLAGPEGLGQLATLRELTLVGALPESDLGFLAALRSLRRLVLRNASLTQDAVDALRRELPGCTIDWRPDARYFDTRRAFVDHASR